MAVTNKLMEVFPKLQEGGGFEFLKIAGSTRSRNLSLLQCPNTGYTLAYLKDPSTTIGQATIYIRPLQQDLPIDSESSGHASGPAISCITCQKEVPFSEMKLHRANCDGTPMQETHREGEGDRCEENDREPPTDRDSVPVRPETSVQSGVEPVVIESGKIDLKELDNGGVGQTLLFEGEPDHLVPAASEVLIESNLFRVAGRMIGHSFLHDGPHVTGLSPAVIHVLFNGDPEMATIVVEDCPDLHIRSIIQMLELEELTQEQKDTVSDLSLSWDLPAVTKTNQRWLHNKLLVHAVIGRTMRQIKQLRKGLKDVMLWPLLTSRPDVVPLLFPKMAGMQFVPQMFLDKITWPVEDSDDEDEGLDIECKCRITGFLRVFIETASSDTLAQLLKFWVGWEMLPSELKVEFSGGTFPSSSTCFETLKLPAHYNTYKDFEEALVAAIDSAHTGFGLV
ncbi:G2/M phase-specific E3 ubiquitin-protein ligase-like isoform 5-T5 [Tautogolabrus adspersus]